MHAITSAWDPASGWTPSLAELAAGARDGGATTLAIVFAETDDDGSRAAITALRSAVPTAVVIGCSTAGLIRGTQVSAAPVVAAVMHFDEVRPSLAWTVVEPSDDSSAAGERLGASLAAHLPAGEPASVLVLADGIVVNGTSLLEGLTRALPSGVGVFGGLAGDGSRFADTWVYADGELRRGAVAAVALAGRGLTVGYGSAGGWQGFGPFRAITRAEGNVLYTLDDRPALGLYKEYLGDRAADLPASALLFPLQIRSPEGDTEVVRTILSIDDEAETMTFAGHIPQGWTARLMRTTLDSLIDAASLAAEGAGGPHVPDLAIAVSCVGRRLVLGQRTDEEVEAALEVLGRSTPMIGFYSYGEIAPGPSMCELHNQTMTVTTLRESR